MIIFNITIMAALSFFSLLIAVISLLAVWPWPCFISTIVCILSFVEFAHRQYKDMTKDGGGLPWWWWL